MKENGLWFSKEIYKVQTDKKLIVTCDNLKPAPPEHYAQIHRRGEVINGKKESSLIQIWMYDYSSGTKENNKKVSFNLEPGKIEYIFSRMNGYFPDFSMTENKIFGEPDQNGRSIVQTYSITRTNQDTSGNLMRYPWKIHIQNGKGVRAKNANGGYYMQRNSYVPEKDVQMSLSDADAYLLFGATLTYIKNWEKYQFKKLFDEAVKLMQAEQQRRQESINGIPVPYPDTAAPVQHQSRNIGQNYQQGNGFVQYDEYGRPNQYQGQHMQGANQMPQPGQNVQGAGSYQNDPERPMPYRYGSGYGFVDNTRNNYR